MVRQQSVPAPSVRDGLVRERVVVTMDNQQGFVGVLWSADSTGVVLRSAAGQPVEFIEIDGVRTEVDGQQVFIPEARVLFMQILGAAGG